MNFDFVSKWNTTGILLPQVDQVTQVNHKARCIAGTSFNRHV